MQSILIIAFQTVLQARTGSGTSRWGWADYCVGSGDSRFLGRTLQVTGRFTCYLRCKQLRNGVRSARHRDRRQLARHGALCLRVIEFIRLGQYALYQRRDLHARARTQCREYRARCVETASSRSMLAQSATPRSISVSIRTPTNAMLSGE